jgi:hypothetical protein
MECMSTPDPTPLSLKASLLQSHLDHHTGGEDGDVAAVPQHGAIAISKR